MIIQGLRIFLQGLGVVYYAFMVRPLPGRYGTLSLKKANKLQYQFERVPTKPAQHFPTKTTNSLQRNKKELLKDAKAPVKPRKTKILNLKDARFNRAARSGNEVSPFIMHLLEADMTWFVGVRRRFPNRIYFAKENSRRKNKKKQQKHRKPRKKTRTHQENSQNTWKTTTKTLKNQKPFKKQENQNVFVALYCRVTNRKGGMLDQHTGLPQRAGPKFASVHRLWGPSETLCFQVFIIIIIILFIF